MTYALVVIERDISLISSTIVFPFLIKFGDEISIVLSSLLTSSWVRDDIGSFPFDTRGISLVFHGG